MNQNQRLKNANKQVAKMRFEALKRTIIFLVIVILGIAFIVNKCSGTFDKDEKIVININDKPALEKYIQGKWSWEKHTNDVNMTWRYRFEISGNTLRIWKSVNNTEDAFDMSEGYEEFHFTLGEPTRDVDGYKARYLEFPLFDKSNFFGLTYENLAPFWIVSDEKWDTPVLKCGSGIPSWSREDFQVIGKKIIIKDWDDNNSSESSNSNSFDENNSEQQNFDENESSLIDDRSESEKNGILESSPSFPGGTQGLRNYLANNIIYPEIASENGIEGKVIVSFSITENGYVDDVTIERGISDCTDCNNEALRVINKMPRWIPAKRDGIAVKTKMNVPIIFKSN